MVEGAAGFIRTFLLDRYGPLLDTCLILYFNHKALVAAVTVILAIAYIAAYCCS